ncbi:MAG: hypothetical protein LBP23_01625 [Treponema sp.]|jgi:hypothetical protein|nr:hypothetical protein [Treponema sp.]
MKKFKIALAVLPLIAAFFMAGCADMLMERPEVSSPMAGGEGLLMISLAGVNVGSASARTMLPADPQFTRYELDVDGTTYPFYNSTFQIPLADGTHIITAKGYEGDKLVATSGSPQPVSISTGGITPITFTLKPYMGVAAETGVLSFSLNWDGLSRMPWRAELLVEEYADANGALIGPAPVSYDIIPTEFVSGAGPGFIRLLDRDSARVNQAGSLTLPPGEYRLTMSVTMDPDTAPASRLDFAHIYSNLTTPAPFYYGGGDLYISNTSPDSGASFITGFTFTETPNATTVIGSEPGADGTRMIMIMVPAGTNLTQLTPKVTCAPGAVITSPLPATMIPSGIPNPVYTQGEIDFSNPTVWTAQAKNGAVQKYTVVVSDTPDTATEAQITYFFFDGHTDCPGVIDETAHTIHVLLPHGTGVTALTPVISIIGKRVSRWDGAADQSVGSFNFSSADTGGTPVTYRVYAGNNSNHQDYDVTVDAAPGTAAITRFAIEGYPDRAVTSTTNPYGVISANAITLKLPYGVPLKNLTPLIQYTGISLNPASGVRQNFSGPVNYTVTPDTGPSTTYQVTITNDGPDHNLGMLEFWVRNNDYEKVVIGQEPRKDGKIPIVIQVPYGTDETNMIAGIRLSSPTAQIHPFVSGAPSSNPADNVKIPFNNAGNPKEAVYRVTAQDPAFYQDYVAVVSKGGQYYYVDGTRGDDDYPDVYNGQSEDMPFKTLAYAVQQAALHASISKIFLLGDLSAANQTGTGANSTYINSDNVVTINGSSGKKITITSTSGAVIRGASGKRVVSVTGGADLVFENISITGGNTTGNGGGIHVGGNSKVKFTGGSITGNTAASGGGVYVEGPQAASADHSEFTFMGGEISGNTATSAAAGNTDATLSGMGGGGGVYVKDNALFWLASGTIANNTAKGAGGGVLVNGHVYSAPNLEEYGFLMSGGKIVSNKSTSTTYPHGGGGAYVAKGAFEMLGGEITGNTATRQGGGVFVHWGQARLTASGNSTITGNEGVGSSKAICSRGTTEMQGNARADKVYIWNYDDGSLPYNSGNNQRFELAENAQITGIVLAYSVENANVIEIANSFENSSVICTIDLESHLNNGGVFAGQLEPDWLNKKIITGSNTTLTAVVTNNRLPLNSFTGQPSVYNLGNHYKIDVSGTDGTFKKK